MGILFTSNLIAIGVPRKVAVMHMCMDFSITILKYTKVCSSFNSSSLCIIVKWVMFDMDILLYVSLAFID